MKQEDRWALYSQQTRLGNSKGEDMKNKNKATWIVFGVICMIAVGLGAFFAVKHFQKQETDDTEVTTEVKEETEDTEATTEAKVQSQYKEPAITGAKKTQQLGEPTKNETVVDMEVKGFGHMKFKFFLDEAPKAVENFVTLASNGYYDGVKFHRVIKEFMIQGGDPTGSGNGGESIWGELFENEISTKLLPLRGALCMANSGGTATNGSQFFVIQNPTVTDDMITQSGVSFSKSQQELLKEQGGYPSLAGGYTIFGQLYEGYDVLDKIAAVETVSDAQSEDRPKSDVVIQKITVSNYK